MEFENTPDSEDGDRGVFNSIVVHVRNTLATNAFEYFKVMTSKSEMGWPDVSSDDFLTVMAEAIHLHFLRDSDSWALHDQLFQKLMQGSVPSCSKEYMFGESATPRSEELDNSSLRSRVRGIMRKEFSIYFFAFQSNGKIAAPQIGDLQLIELIADGMQLLGIHRGVGSAYAHTLAHYLDDLILE